MYTDCSQMSDSSSYYAYQKIPLNRIDLINKYVNINEELRNRCASVTLFTINLKLLTQNKMKLTVNFTEFIYFKLNTLSHSNYYPYKLFYNSFIDNFLHLPNRHSE